MAASSKKSRRASGAQLARTDTNAATITTATITTTSTGCTSVVQVSTVTSSSLVGGPPQQQLASTTVATTDSSGNKNITTTTTTTPSRQGSVASSGGVMQRCGLCSLISRLIRRAMCVGSRRGSGESYYQELAETAVSIYKFINYYFNCFSTNENF